MTREKTNSSTTTSDVSSEDHHQDEVTIYVLTGSQYCAKVLAALDSVHIPHHVVTVSFDLKKRAEELPSGGRKVPEMKVVTTSTDGQQPQEVIVQDSEAILQWFDDRRGTHFCSVPNASALSTRAGDEVLAGCVLYYNWVNGEGYARSVRKSIKDQALPHWLPLRGAVTDLAVKSERTKFRHEVIKMLKVTEEQLADEPYIRQMLVNELKFFESHFKTPQQPYLLGSEPTAADFSVYAQLERLVGDTGDAEVFCSLPELLERKDLERLWQWYRHMRQEHPIVFHGKGPSSDTTKRRAKKATRSP